MGEVIPLDEERAAAAKRKQALTAIERRLGKLAARTAGAEAGRYPPEGRLGADAVAAELLATGRALLALITQERDVAARGATGSAAPGKDMGELWTVLSAGMAEVVGELAVLAASLDGGRPDGGPGGTAPDRIPAPPEG